MAANALTIAKKIADLTKGERALVLELSEVLTRQRKYTPRKKAVEQKARRVVVVARKAKDPNAPKRKYTKRAAFWNNKKK